MRSLRGRSRDLTETEVRAADFSWGEESALKISSLTAERRDLAASCSWAGRKFHSIRAKISHAGIRHPFAARPCWFHGSLCRRRLTSGTSRTIVQNRMKPSPQRDTIVCDMSLAHRHSTCAKQMTWSTMSTMVAANDRAKSDRLEGKCT